MIRFSPRLAPIPFPLRACLAAIALSVGGTALAQGTAAAPKPAIPPAPSAPVKPATPAKPPVEETPAVIPSVTVEAERPTNRIDRQVYDVKADVGSTNASAADALANVPSVAVDPDGTVSLRGSTNVQILIDGKPSAMLQGENRGAALNAMPSDDIESIEVINNPGAQFGNEGGGGPILNFVMRRNRRAGGLGTVNANVGTGGRYNAAANGSYNEGLFSYQGGINVRHDGRDTVAAVARQRINPVAGTITRSTQDAVSKGLNDSAGLNAGMGYNLGDNDKLSAAASYAKRSNDNQAVDRYITFGLNDAATTDYRRESERNGDSVNWGWNVRHEHKGDSSGEILKTDLRMSSSTNRSDSRFANIYAIRPAGTVNPDNRQQRLQANKITDLTGDYELPIERSIVKAGYKASLNQGVFDTDFDNIDPATGTEVPNVARINRFEVDETNYALYGSYQHRFNERWGVLGGMRAEYTRMDIHQVTTSIKEVNTSFSWVPSAYVSYKASDQTNVRLSYSRRIRRPNPNDLNPFVVYLDELNVSSGNPNLRLSQSDGVELGFDTQFGIVDTNLRLYARKEKDLISERRYFIEDNVLLTTRDNLNSNTTSGVEFTFNAKVSKTLSVNAGGNFGRFEQDQINLNGQAFRRAVTSLTLRARANWQVTPEDVLQVTMNGQGRTLFGQSVREPYAIANFSYRRTLTPRLNLALNVQDAFESNKFKSATDTDILKDRSLRRFEGRVIYIGLAYRLGGITPQPRGQRPEGQRPDGQQRQGPGIQRRGPGQQGNPNEPSSI